MRGNEFDARDEQHHAHFFTRGGDSLKATRFVEVLRGKHGPIVSLRSFFAAPTVAAVAEALDVDVEEAPSELVWRPM